MTVFDETITLNSIGIGADALRTAVGAPPPERLDELCRRCSGQGNRMAHPRPDESSAASHCGVETKSEFREYRMPVTPQKFGDSEQFQHFTNCSLSPNFLTASFHQFLQDLRSGLADVDVAR